MDTRTASKTDTQDIATLWNERLTDDASCWKGAPLTDKAALDTMLDKSVAFELVEDNGAPVGFVFWQGVKLGAVCSSTERGYYEGLAKYVAAMDAQATPTLCTVVPARDTNEYKWLSALGVVRFEPHGYSAITSDQKEADRVLQSYRVSADTKELVSAVAAKLQSLAGGK